MVPADPYAWPYDGPVQPRRLALVIAGAQVAWEQRSVDSAGVSQVLETVSLVVRGVGGLVVHLRHGSTTRGRGGLPPSRLGPEWFLATAPDPADLVIDCEGMDGFFGSALDHELRRRRIDTLVFGGFGAEVAVSSTLRSANDRGYECLTLTDGSAPFSADTGASTLHSITMSGGIFGAIARSGDLLAALAPIPVPAQIAQAEALP